MLYVYQTYIYQIKHTAGTRGRGWNKSLRENLPSPLKQSPTLSLLPVMSTTLANSMIHHCVSIHPPWNKSMQVCIYFRHSLPEQPILEREPHVSGSGSPPCLFRLIGSGGGSVGMLAPGHDIRFCSVPWHPRPFPANRNDTGWLPSLRAGLIFRGTLSILGGKLGSNPSWLQATIASPIDMPPSAQTLLHWPSSSHTSRMPVESALLKVSLVLR